MTAKIELVLQVRSDPYSDTVRPGTKIPQGMTGGVSDGSDLISHKRYSSGSTASYKANFNRFIHERTYVDFMD